MKGLYPSLYFNIGWWGMYFVRHFEDNLVKTLVAAITLLIFTILLFTEQDK